MNQTPNFENFKRDANGLLPSISYVHNPDGSVNWRAMIDSKHLVIQRGKEGKVIEAAGGKDLSEIDLKTVDDKYLLIKISGIKELAKIRGINSCIPTVTHSDTQSATAVCVIEFMANYETDGQIIKFGDVGSATLESTEGFGKLYLASMAMNRAFVRTVRNFLGINIVAQDEVKNGDIADDSSSSLLPSDNPYDRLAVLAAEKKVTFADIQKGASTKYRAEIESDPTTWTGFKDIPRQDIWTLLGHLKKVK